MSDDSVHARVPRSCAWAQLRALVPALRADMARLAAALLVHGYLRAAEPRAPPAAAAGAPARAAAAPRSAAQRGEALMAALAACSLEQDGDGDPGGGGGEGAGLLRAAAERGGVSDAAAAAVASVRARMRLLIAAACAAGLPAIRSASFAPHTPRSSVHTRCDDLIRLYCGRAMPVARMRRVRAAGGE